KIFEFLKTARECQINATSVIYLRLKENCWISQDELRSIINRAVTFASNLYMEGTPRRSRILQISSQKLVRQIKPVLSLSVKNKCNEFLSSFSNHNYSGFPEKLVHDQTWKEFEEKILSVVNENFNTMKDIWNNSALNFEVAGTLNEGTYQSTIIVPFIRAVLKDLPFRSSFISTSERESAASVDRKGNGQAGRCSDIMFMVKHLDMLFEIMYVECSRLVCTPQKTIDDDVKLWRECNDVAGDILHLNVLIRDQTNVNRYYNIESAKIPMQKSEETVVIKFVETLLLLYNIVITNLSLLYHRSVCISERQKEDSTTVNSE
ncbi:20161_t:CDS:2, partial [Racocetra persica]